MHEVVKKSTSGRGKMSSVKLPRMLNEAQTDLAMSDIHSMRVCREFI